MRSGFYERFEHETSAAKFVLKLMHFQQKQYRITIAEQMLNAL